MTTNQEVLDIGFAHDRTTGKEEWLTPPWLLRELGEFDLDPCAPIKRHWATAKQHFAIQDNGMVNLSHPFGVFTRRNQRRLPLGVVV